MYYMGFIFAIMVAQGGKVSIFQKSQLLKMYRFLVWVLLNKA